MLQIDSICSIRIRSRNRNNFEKPKVGKPIKGQRPEASLSRATANPPLKGTDFLQEVDQDVKSIMKDILTRQKENGGQGGTEIIIEGQEVYLVNQMRLVFASSSDYEVVIH